MFDVAADETEHHDLAASQPALLATMHARLVELNQALYEPDRGEGDPAACAAAMMACRRRWRRARWPTRS